MALPGVLQEREYAKFKDTIDGTAVRVYVIDTDGKTVGGNFNFFQETVDSIASGIETLILTYTVPGGNEFYFQACDVSSNNISAFRLVIDGETWASCRTYFGSSLQHTIEMNNFRLIEGQVVEVFGIHERPSLAKFESRIYGLIK